MSLEERIVNAIEADLTNRTGLMKQWDLFGKDAQIKIRQTWVQIIRNELAKPTPNKCVKVSANLDLRKRLNMLKLAFYPSKAYTEIYPNASVNITSTN